MDIKQAFARSLKEMRQRRAATQEDFSEVSSRTYISMIERGLKCPTLEKVDDFAQVLQVHPLSLLCLAYQYAEGAQDIDRLLERVRSELVSG
ncbi:MAG: helix-turn-helix transcriptional regulator [Thiobacillus sp.]|nr:helix-turn-helix transcriptional regulator [Thiobacillus sp.]